MTHAGDLQLAEELTKRIVALDGVRGLFPSHTIAAAVLTAVATTSPSTALVDVDSRGALVRVTARLATDRRTPSVDVISAVRRIVVDSTRDRPFELRIELAHID